MEPYRKHEEDFPKEDFSQKKVSHFPKEDFSTQWSPVFRGTGSLTQKWKRLVEKIVVAR